MSTKPKKILIVDDEVKNRALLAAYLDVEGHEHREAVDGRQAIEMVKDYHPDLILMDIMMPVMDGFKAAKWIKDTPETRHIPIIMLTALEDRESRIRGLETGAEEYLTKPIDRMDLKIRMRNMLRLKEFSDFLKTHNQILEQRVHESTQALKDSFVETIYTLMRAAEYRDDETGVHVKRISFYARTLAEKLDMNKAFRETVFYASPMHDIGKIGIPDNILLKPGGFTPEEWEIMKTHTTIGAGILEGQSSPYLQMGHDIALSHHERWDGGGYPQGSKGEAIPLPARIMQVCDVYDALRSKRPYKPAFDHGKTMHIITQGDGRTEPSHFDPEVLAAFQSCAGDLEEIFDARAE
ncbi:MAG: response regulator [Mariprofundaceae bacterium]|nr:response regulator [Mariprofundaceae bacterium]